MAKQPSYTPPSPPWPPAPLFHVALLLLHVLTTAVEEAAATPVAKAARSHSDCCLAPPLCVRLHGPSPVPRPHPLPRCHRPESRVRHRPRCPRSTTAREPSLLPSAREPNRRHANPPLATVGPRAEPTVACVLPITAGGERAERSTVLRPPLPLQRGKATWKGESAREEANASGMASADLASEERRIASWIPSRSRYRVYWIAISGGFSFFYRYKMR
jgi:hypothetical protein